MGALDSEHHHGHGRCRAPGLARPLRRSPDPHHPPGVLAAAAGTRARGPQPPTSSAARRRRGPDPEAERADAPAARPVRGAGIRPDAARSA